MLVQANPMSSSRSQQLLNPLATELGKIGQYDPAGNEFCLSKLEQEGINAKLIGQRKVHYGLLRVSSHGSFSGIISKNRANDELIVTEHEGKTGYLFRIPTGKINEDYWCLAESL